MKFAAGRIGSLLLALLGTCVADSTAHESKADARLPLVGAAPDFALTTQAGNRLSLTDLRGKVVAVTFIFAVSTGQVSLQVA